MSKKVEKIGFVEKKLVTEITTLAIELNMSVWIFESSGNISVNNEDKSFNWDSYFKGWGVGKFGAGAMIPLKELRNKLKNLKNNK